MTPSHSNYLFTWGGLPPFQGELMRQIKETLFGEPKGGKAKQWAVYVEGDVVTVEWGRVGGKLQTKQTVCTSKNIGKVNQTTPEQQAELEALSKWEKQYTNKLYRHTIEEAVVVGELLPMLAIDGSKKPEKIQFPCDIQPKLDGVRCMVYLEDGEVKAISRQGKFYELHSQLKEELRCVLSWSGQNKLDGELYKHGMKLQDIVSAVRNTKNPKHNQIEFHLFDIPYSPIWGIRRDLLSEISKANDTKYVKVVNYCSCHNIEQLHQSVDDFMEQGYEGTMVRNINGRYEFNHRSNDLIKLKVMQDSEALVIDCREDKNNEGVLLCSWNNIQFECKMKGSHAERLFTEQQKLIGQWINFKYQALTNEGKPQFPVGLYVRPCSPDGCPLE